MAGNEVLEADENVRVLRLVELELEHRLEGHPQDVAGCPVCVSHGRVAA